MVRYCKSCGSELQEGSVFCDECGTKITETQSSPDSTLFSTYNVDMMDGETVIRHSQIHVGCLILPAIVFGLGIIYGFITFILLLDAYYYYPGAVILGFFNIFTIVGLIWLIIRIIGYLSNDLILTNKRVFGKCGLISTTQMQSPLNRIDSVSYSNGIVGKLIGYGTVRIATASTTFKFRYIREGQTLYNDIFHQLEASEAERRSDDARAIADAMAEKIGD